MFFDLAHAEIRVYLDVFGRLLELISSHVACYVVCSRDVFGVRRTIVNAKCLEEALRLLTEDRVADEHLLLSGVLAILAFVPSLVWLLVLTDTPSTVE